MNDLLLRSWPVPEEHQIELVALGDGWLEIEAKLFDEQTGAFGVTSFDGLSLIAGLENGLIVDCEVEVSHLIGSTPIVILKQRNIHAPF